MGTLQERSHRVEYVTHYDQNSPWVYVKIDGIIEASCKSRELAVELFQRYDNGLRPHHKPLPEFAIRNSNG